MRANGARHLLGVRSERAVQTALAAADVIDRHRKYGEADGRVRGVAPPPRVSQHLFDRKVGVIVLRRPDAVLALGPHGDAIQRVQVEGHVARIRRRHGLLW